MRIRLSHPAISYVELSDGIKAQAQDKQIVVSHQRAKELAVGHIGTTLHMVSLSDNNCLHWFGKDTFSSQSVELADNARGIKLVAEKDGLHLVYIAPRQNARSLALYHQPFHNAWQKPRVITANVTDDPENFTIVYGPDNYLHLVYINNLDGYMYYRVYDKKQQSWSGGVPLARTTCKNPKLLADELVHLVWIEEADSDPVLKYRVKDQRWGKPELLSSPGSPVHDLGWYLAPDILGVIWLQEGSLWRRILASGWQPAEQIGFDSVRKEEQVVSGNNDSTNQVVVYTDVSEEQEPQTTKGTGETIEVKQEPSYSQEKKDLPSTPAPEQKREVRKDNTTERELEQELIKQAFQLRAEWEKFREQLATAPHPEPKELEAHLNQAIDKKLSSSLAEVYQKLSQLDKEQTSPVESKVAEKISEWEKRITYLEKKLSSSVEERIANLEQRLARLHEEVRSQTTRLATVDKLQQRITHLEGTVSRLRSNINKHSTSDPDSRLASLERQITRINRQLKEASEEENEGSLIKKIFKR